jgi:lysophospholipase L1-like esterase
MTIRFTKSWNGYYEGQIVSNPAGGNTEAQLIALGYAVSDLDGPDNSFELAKFATDPLTGAVTGLAGPGDTNIGMVTHLGTTCVIFGDSFSARNKGATTSRDLDWGYFNWAQALMGAPFTLLRNAGTSGNRTDEMLARMTDVTSYNPDWCFVQGGINDITYGTTAAQVALNLQNICTQLVGRGIRVVLLAVAPNSQSAGNSRKVQQVNQAMREWCKRSYGQVIFVDTYAAMVDSTLTTGALASGMSDDSLHPSGKGARAMGQAIATALQYLIPNRNWLPSSNGESYGIDSSSKQLLDNPMHGTGSAVSATGTGASGTVPSSWLGSASGMTAGTAVFTPSQTRSDGIGLEQKIVVANAEASSSVNIRQNPAAARFAIGDTVYFVGQMRVSGAANIKTLSFGGSVTIDSVAQQINCLEASGTTNYDSSDATLTFQSKDLVLTGTTINSSSFVAAVTFNASGSGTFYIGRCGFYKR